MADFKDFQSFDLEFQSRPLGVSEKKQEAVERKKLQILEFLKRVSLRLWSVS